MNTKRFLIAFIACAYSSAMLPVYPEISNSASLRSRIQVPVSITQIKQDIYALLHEHGFDVEYIDAFWQQAYPIIIKVVVLGSGFAIAALLLKTGFLGGIAGSLVAHYLAKLIKNYAGTDILPNNHLEMIRDVVQTGTLERPVQNLLVHAVENPEVINAVVTRVLPFAIQSVHTVVEQVSRAAVEHNVAGKMRSLFSQENVEHLGNSIKQGWSTLTHDLSTLCS